MRLPLSSSNRLLLRSIPRRPQQQQHVHSRHLATYERPTPPPGPNAHRSFWLSFGRPIAKVFLGALFTYQLTYLAWAKLESMEEEQIGDADITALQTRLRTLAPSPARSAKNTETDTTQKPTN